MSIVYTTFSNEPPYSYIIDNIYVGNILGLESDVVNNVEQIISLVPNPLKHKFINSKIHVYEFIFKDDPDINIIEYASKVFEILNNGKPTFIHCNAGKSRSISCVLFYIMKKHNISFDNAYKILEEKRPTIDINIGFYSQLYFSND